MNRASLAFVLLALAATPAAAQLTRHVELDAGVLAARYRSTGLGTGGSLNGLVAGGELRTIGGPVGLRAWYAEGKLAPDTGLAPSTDFVEGGLLVGLRVQSWGALSVGPRLRAYVVPGFTERWTFLEAHARVAGDLSTLVRAYGELWMAFSADAGAGQRGSGGRGGAAGLTATIPGSKLWLRAGYTIDRVVQASGGIEVLDGVTVRLGYGGDR